MPCGDLFLIFCMKTINFMNNVKQSKSFKEVMLSNSIWLESPNKKLKSLMLLYNCSVYGRFFFNMFNTVNIKKSALHLK